MATEADDGHPPMTTPPESNTAEWLQAAHALADARLAEIARLRDRLALAEDAVAAARALSRANRVASVLVVDTATGNTFTDWMTNLRAALARLDETAPGIPQTARSAHSASEPTVAASDSEQAT